MFSKNQDSIIEMAVKFINFEQRNNGGRVPHKLIPRVMDCLAWYGIHGVTRDLLNGRLRRFKAKHEGKQQGPSPSIPQTIALINNNNNVGHQSNNNDNDNGRIMTSTTRTTVVGRPHEDKSLGVLTGPRPSRGRPKGTTKKVKAKQQSNKTNEIDE